LSGGGLTIADAERILLGQVETLTVTPLARRNVEKARRVVTDLLDNGDTIYGVNTGFGKLSNQRIAPTEVLALQQNLLRSHAVGMGELLPRNIARLTLALRIQALAKGYSGVTIELIDALVELFNRGIAPAIPGQGSVGASGDLAPLAHLALVATGEGYAFVGQGAKLMSGQAALRKVHLRPYHLQSKEGLSLINGTQVSTALLAEALVRARRLAKIADVAGAMTLESTRCSLRPFDPRIQPIRPPPAPA